MLVDASVARLKFFLCRRGCLLVHFSGMSYGGRIDTRYPADLRYAIANRKTYGACCSTVMPTDYFRDDRVRPSNATGTIGVIVLPRTRASLLTVRDGDDGTPLARIDRPVPMAHCRQAVDHRVGYNEWVVRAYDVLGILAVEPMVYLGRHGGPIPGAEGTPPEYLKGRVPAIDNDFVGTDLEEISKVFPDLRIFTFEDGRLRRWGLGGSRKASIAGLYAGAAIATAARTFLALVGSRSSRRR